MQFIDSHAHINDPAFDADRSQIIKACFDAGMSHMLEIACEIPEWQQAINLSLKYKDKIFPVCGIHPMFAQTLNDDSLKTLETFLANPLVRGVGEIGLDYFFLEDCPKNIQIEACQKLMALSLKYKKPVVIHCRKSKDPQDFSAYDDFAAILKEVRVFGGVEHCFGGRYSDAVTALDNGLLLGVNGTISYKRNNDLRDTIKKIGLKYLLLETDCPYLPPQTKRGTRNSPLNIPEIAGVLAEILGIGAEKAADAASENTRKLFNF